MIYFCDFKVNSLPNQKLLYEKRYNIISDTFDKPKIFKAVFQTLSKRIFLSIPERKREWSLSSSMSRNHRSLANQKTGNIFS